jgi:hypothetical protein
MVGAIQGVEPGEQQPLPGGGIRQQLDIPRVGLRVRPGADGTESVIQDAGPPRRPPGDAEPANGCDGAPEDRAA